MRIFLLGLPGAGKGTQGKALSQALGIPHVSLGDFARDLAQVGLGELADVIRQVHKQGQWQPLPTDIAVALFRESVANKKDFIIDGFPRDKAQLGSFQYPWSCDDTLQNIFIHLQISEDESLRRILSRDRLGDSSKKWQQRIELERVRLPELIESLPAYGPSGRNWNSLITIDGNQSVDSITHQILENWLIRYLQLSESDRDLIFGLIDPYDRCFGSIFHLHEEDVAYRVQQILDDGRSIQVQWEELELEK